MLSHQKELRKKQLITHWILPNFQFLKKNCRDKKDLLALLNYEAEFFADNIGVIEFAQDDVVFKIDILQTGRFRVLWVFLVGFNL
jgi:hypothetical protein